MRYCLKPTVREYVERTLKQPKHKLFYLVDIVLSFQAEQRTEATFNKIHCYEFGILAYLFEEWGFKIELAKELVIAWNTSGLLDVCDSRFGDQQTRRLSVSSHNTHLSTIIERLFMSTQLFKKKFAGFKCRNNFEIFLG